MDRSDDQTLFAELRELRPTPRPEFTAELDERAAAGFPRRDPRAGAGPFARLAAHLRDLRGMKAHQWMVPAVGLAIALLTVGIVAVAIGGGGGSSSELMTSATSAEGGGGGAIESEAAEVGGEALKEEEAKGKLHGAVPPVKSHGQFEGNFFGEGSVEAPPLNGFADGERAPGAARVHRDVERSASIVLGTKPGEVAAAASKVYAAVHAANGVVLSSSVQSGHAGPTGATFSLLIPSRKLDDALASFSQIAEVRSRHDATNDITAPTVGVTEELRDSNASIEGLLKELGNVETESERESVEARLREERRRHAAIRASLEHLHKRASMSEVSVRIVTSHGAGIVPAGKGDGNWSVGDALRDAGHILTVAAGVLLIALAILAPIALIALLLWSANRFRVRRLRERALG